MLLLRVVYRADEGDRQSFAGGGPLRGGGPAFARLPAGARNDLCVCWLRARRIDPCARLSPQLSRLPERPVQNGAHRQGLPGVRNFNERRLPRISEDKSHARWGLVVRL